MSDRAIPFFSRLRRALRVDGAAAGPRTHAAWSMLGNSSQQALSFLIFALLARFLDPRQVGLLAICHLINQGVRTIVIDSLAIPVTRKPSLSADDSSWSFTFITTVALLLAALLVLGADVVEWLFQAPGLAPVLRAMSLVIVISGLSRVYESRLVRGGAYRLMALRSIGAIAAGGIVAVPMAMSGFGVWALVGQQLTYEVVQLVIAAASERRTWTPRWLWSRDRLRWNVRESMTLFAGAAPTFAATNADTALVSLLFGPTELGLYSFTKRILSAIYLAGGVSISAVGFTQYIKFQNEPVPLRQALTRNVGLSFFILIFAYLCLYLTASQAIAIVFGGKWLGALPLFPVLIAASLFQLLWTQCASLSLAIGEPKRIAQLSMLQLMLLLVTALVVSRVADLGAVAVGIAVFFSSMTCGLWLAVLTVRRIALPAWHLVRSVLPSLVAAAVIVMAADWAGPSSASSLIAQSVVRLGLVSLVVLLLYAALTYAIRSIPVMRSMRLGDS